MLQAISRILSWAIIYLLPQLPAVINLPTLRHGSGPLRRFTWHFSIQGLPAKCITALCRELLPHVFILILLLAGRLFSVALSVVLYIYARLFTGILPYAVRTFLPAKSRAIARLVTLQRYSKMYNAY